MYTVHVEQKRRLCGRHNEPVMRWGGGGGGEERGDGIEGGLDTEVENGKGLTGQLEIDACSFPHYAL